MPGVLFLGFLIVADDLEREFTDPLLIFFGEPTLLTEQEAALRADVSSNQTEVPGEVHEAVHKARHMRGVQRVAKLVIIDSWNCHELLEAATMSG